MPGSAQWFRAGQGKLKKQLVEKQLVEKQLEGRSP